MVERAVHFVGFRGEEYFSAARLFGPPDFFHYYLDNRAIAEFMPGDIVVFANGAERRLHEHAFNDSERF